MSSVVSPSCWLCAVWLSEQKCSILCSGDADYCNLAHSILDDDFRYDMLRGTVIRLLGIKHEMCHVGMTPGLAHLLTWLFWVCYNKTLLCTLAQDQVFSRCGLIASPCFVSSRWGMVSIDATCISTVFILGSLHGFYYCYICTPCK